MSAFNLWMNVPQAKMEIIDKVVGMLHNASGRHRRPFSAPTWQTSILGVAAHTVYGIPRTINAATYIHTLVYEELSHLKSPRLEYRDLIMMMTAELGCLHHGQGLDIMWRDSFRCPTEAEYINMVKNKTGGLLRIGVRLMMACSTTNPDTDFVPLVDLIGVHYQIRDDYLNLRSPEYSANKGFAEDIEEGKFSFPIIHGVHSDTSNQLILGEWTGLKGEFPASLCRCVENPTGHSDFKTRIRTEILALGGNVELSVIIETLRVAPSVA
ncbi:farnesyltranstransferase [Mycena leptocephala]|nr:farnesyltranstransferase [Mycena leptocephala]